MIGSTYFDTTAWIPDATLSLNSLSGLVDEDTVLFSYSRQSMVYLFAIHIHAPKSVPTPPPRRSAKISPGRPSRVNRANKFKEFSVTSHADPEFK